jgi:pimeloyl-ACP methyl ester carboxylesterase
MMTSSASQPTRRQLLQGSLAAGLTVATTAVLGQAPANAAPATGATGIRPFRVAIPRERLAEMRRRVAATRWPTRELVTDRSQGVQLATAQALARFWATTYDWRRFEAKLNALPQFTTEIDGVDIHFVHVRSRHRNALPLIMTHGWPGSLVELLETIGPLTNPTAHGGTAADAFHVVLPSIPGYGFSGKPAELGWDTNRTARAWAELMRRLGYTRYVAQGGDVGAAVTDKIGRQAPAGLAAIHLNLLVPALGSTANLPKNTDEEKTAAAALQSFATTGNGYRVEQATRPQTIGYALLDSPVALGAWMLDHDTDSYLKISRAFRGGPPAGNLTREHVLDNISLYWLTGTGESAARMYWEGANPAAGTPAPAPVTVPVAISAFPGEIFQAPRSWAEIDYPTLGYYNKPARGGHFAAWEEPGLFTREIRAAFRSVR